MDPHSAGKGDGTVEWVWLLRGVRSVLTCSYSWIMEGPLGDLLHLEDYTQSLANENPEDTARFTALEQLWESGYTPDEVDSFKNTLDTLKKIYTMLSLHGGHLDAVSAVLNWPIRAPEVYLQMVNNKQPEALILLAHYCLLLNKVDKFWWMRGMSRHLLQTIHRTLGEKWESWISWPLRDLVLSEFRSKADQDQCPYGLAGRIE
jgi:hypothetical protein